MFFFLDILNIYQICLTYMIKTYYCVWSYIRFCLQSFFQAANVIVGFPSSQEKTSSLFIGTNADLFYKLTMCFGLRKKHLHFILAITVTHDIHIFTSALVDSNGILTLVVLCRFWNVTGTSLLYLVSTFLLNHNILFEFRYLLAWLISTCFTNVSTTTFTYCKF